MAARVEPIMGGDYHVRRFSARRRIDVMEAHQPDMNGRAAQEWMALVVSACLCDEHGNLTHETAEDALDLDADIFDAACEAGLRLNGISQAEHDEKAKD